MTRSRNGLAAALEAAMFAGLDPADRRACNALAAAVAAARWPVRRPDLVDAARTLCGETAPAVAHRANRLGAIVAIDDLLLGRLTPATIDRVVRWEGRERLDRGLAAGKGVVLVFPHAGFQKGLIARLGLSGYGFTQVAARGLPPGEIEDQALAARLAARERREDRLPVRFSGLADPVRGLLRDLERNRVVGVAYDGRGGGKFARVPYLGHHAWLATGPWRLAVSAQATVVPAFVRREQGAWTAMFDEPVPAGDDPDALRDRVLTDTIEPWLTAHPEHYVPWVAHCRRHAARDPHPLFP